MKKETVTLRDTSMRATGQARRWFTIEAPHSEVFALVSQLDREQSTRRTKLDELEYLHDCGGARIGRDYGAGKHGISFNVIKSVVSTVTARIAKNRPRPLFLTSNGNWQQQRRAKKLTTYVAGVFKNAGVYRAMQDAFRDACIGDIGAVRFYADVETAEIRCERVLHNELVVDRRDARYGKPRVVHHRRVVDRWELAALYPDMELEIEAAPAASREAVQRADLLDDDDMSLTAIDGVEVIESWRLPSSAESGDGVHTVCLATATLLREEWKHACHPFVFVYWDRPRKGFYGSGIAHELRGIQYEIARLLKTIQVAQSRTSAGRVMVPRGAKVDPSQLTNEPGSVITYDGQRPPHTEVSPSVHPELYQHLDRLERKGYEQIGVSQMSAQSRKPAGVTAAVAIQSLQDVESERLVLQGQDYDQAHMDAAAIVVMLSRDLYEQGADVTARAPGRRFVEAIKWSDVDMDADKYVMEVFPTSQLPHDPAGRLDYVSALEAKGYLTKEAAMALMSFPDTEAYTSSEVAAYEAIDALIDKMLDDGEPLVPEPYLNLKLCLSKAQAIFARSLVSNELDESQMDLLRGFMDNTGEMLNVGNSNAGPVDPGLAAGGVPAPGGPAPDAGGPPGIPAAA